MENVLPAPEKVIFLSVVTFLITFAALVLTYKMVI